jgi:hypothetical protein
LLQRNLPQNRLAAAFLAQGHCLQNLAAMDRPALAGGQALWALIAHALLAQAPVRCALLLF